MTYRDLYEDALRKLHNSLITLGEFETMVKPLNREVEAEPKTGKWTQISPAKIYECSECGQNVMTGDIEAYKFCHGCGARMRGEEE